jgi:hypothetical protein
MFKPPNYICRVREKDFPDQRPKLRLVFALSEAEARTFLNAKEYEVISIEPYDFAAKWKELTDETHKDAQKRHGKPGFEFPSHWSILKEYLQDVFLNRCAYCDGLYLAFGYGDVEHYRPKGRVTEDPTHPGYWWLAYEPSNYLPSCQLCNQKAKKNHFPIAGIRAKGPDDSLDAELPLLPRADEHRVFDHMRFRPSTDSERPGQAEGLTPKGKTAIEVMELNRTELRVARLTEQQLAKGEYVTALTVLVSRADKSVLQSVVERYQTRKRPFHAAGMDEINSYASSIGFPPPFIRSGNGT